MGSEWKILKLGDLGRIVTGKTPSTSVKSNFGTDIPFITPSDMDGRKIIGKTTRYLSKSGALSVKGATIPKGAVMVSCIGSDMGKAAIAEHDCVTNQQINSIIVEDTYCSEYIYYNLSTRKNEIRHQAAGGSAQPILNKSAFANLQITLPPLPTQKAIAHILGTLDDKIELNRRMNETLEAMARALFKSWFVDFDPVHAKAAGRQPSGMDASTAALFPSTFQPSELGDIPEGWEVAPIKRCCHQVQNGGTPRRNEPRFWEGGTIPWLASGEVRQSIVINTNELITDDALSESSAKWVPPLSTVVALYGATAGQVALTSIRLTTNQAVCSLISKENLSLFVYLSMCRATTEMEAKAVGSAQQNISKGTVESIDIVLPFEPLIKHFNDEVMPIFKRWISNLHQSRNLATLRDTLLPKLLSGEIFV